MSWTSLKFFEKTEIPWFPVAVWGISWNGRENLFSEKMAEKAHPDAPGPKTPIIPKEYQWFWGANSALGPAGPPRNAFCAKKLKSRVRTNFLPPKPENQPRNALFAKMSFKMTKKALSTEAFWAHGRLWRFWAQKSHFGPQNRTLGSKTHFWPQNPQNASKCAKVRGTLIFPVASAMVLRGDFR